MTTAFPADYDDFTNPVASPPGSETLASMAGGRKHSAVISDLQDAVEALEAYIGKTGESNPSITASIVALNAVVLLLQPLDADLTAIAALTTAAFGRGALEMTTATNYRTYIGAGTSSAAGANPSASIGLTAVNGTAGTFLRSDGAPALDQAIAPTWTGLHTFSLSPVTISIANDSHVGLSVKAFSGTQSGNLLQFLDSLGAVRFNFAPGVFDTGFGADSDRGYLAFKPGNREYRIGVYDGGGSFIFHRSDSNAGFSVSPSATVVRFSTIGGTSPLLYIAGNSVTGIVITSYEGGGTGILQFGRRPSDSNAAVGTSAEFWPNTGQTKPVITTVKPGSGSDSGASPVGYRFQVMEDGSIIQASESSTTNAREILAIVPSWASSTDASRKGRVVFSVYDTAIREAFRIEASGSAAMIGFLGANAAVAQTGDAGTALVTFGLMTGTPTFAVANVVGAALCLFDHFADVGNVGTGEDDLYSDTIAAGRLAANGDKLKGEYGGIFVSSATATRQIKGYFGGTMFFDTGALTLSLSSAWTFYISIIRVSSSVVRYMASLTTEGAALAAYTAVGEITGLTLSNTNVLKITGEAAGVGAATNDIVAKMSTVSFVPHA